MWLKRVVCPAPLYLSSLTVTLITYLRVSRKGKGQQNVNWFCDKHKLTPVWVMNVNTKYLTHISYTVAIELFIILRLNRDELIRNNDTCLTLISHMTTLEPADSGICSLLKLSTNLSIKST